jgi:hypothetical protein
MAVVKILCLILLRNCEYFRGRALVPKNQLISLHRIARLSNIALKTLIVSIQVHISSLPLTMKLIAGNWVSMNYVTARIQTIGNNRRHMILLSESRQIYLINILLFGVGFSLK